MSALGKPVGDRILIDRDHVETEEKVGNLFVIREDIKPPSSGTVIEKGGDVKEVVIGDTVHFSDYAGTEVVLDGNVLLVIRETDVLIVC